mmetsp:Transcript_11443/g.24688  ORF Transcript_11443/g.24688 Transcript_11443/m.24688 type:complete len:320 (-) Transcript_11443:930-1889(-)
MFSSNAANCATSCTATTFAANSCSPDSPSSSRTSRTAIARQRRACCDDHSSTFASTCCLAASVRARLFGTPLSYSRANAHLEMTFSGAPFASSRSPPPLCWCCGLTSTLMLFRSREKSSVASFAHFCRHAARTPIARSASGSCSISALSFASATPSRSARTASAASVPSPIFPNEFESDSNTILLSLHNVPTSATSPNSNPSSEPSRAAGNSTRSLPVAGNGATDPRGSSAWPATSNSASSSWGARSATRSTLMLFVVSVPVLSLQITVVQPSASTAGKCRTIALRRDILLVPSARHVVTTAGKPSGMAATASAIAILK